MISGDFSGTSHFPFFRRVVCFPAAVSLSLDMTRRSTPDGLARNISGIGSGACLRCCETVG
jgi:hypothetical protein